MVKRCRYCLKKKPLPNIRWKKFVEKSLWMDSRRCDTPTYQRLMFAFCYCVMSGNMFICLFSGYSRVKLNTCLRWRDISMARVNSWLPLSRRFLGKLLLRFIDVDVTGWASSQSNYHKRKSIFHCLFQCDQRIHASFRYPSRNFIQFSAVLWSSRKPLRRCWRENDEWNNLGCPRRELFQLVNELWLILSHELWLFTSLLMHPSFVIKIIVIDGNRST